MVKRPPKPVRHYLVTIAATYNDIPVRIFTNLAEAREFAHSFDVESHIDQLADMIGQADYGDIIAVAITCFRDGIPFRHETFQEIRCGYFS